MSDFDHEWVHSSQLARNSKETPLKQDAHDQRLHLPILTFAWLSVRQYRSKNEARIRKAKLNIFIFRKD
jgi:hypothetical protein